MQIERVKISDINPAPYNPRKDLKPDDPEYQKLKKSIEEFDCVEPLVMNKRGNVLIGGHQRIKILKARGDTEVDVSIVDLPPEKEKALNIVLNNPAGSWDMPLLKDLLEELDTGAFDMDITGFDSGEIEELMTQFRVDDEEKDNAVPETPETPMSKRGKIYLLDEHRLMCGDATSEADVARLMDGQKAMAAITDPPYGINFKYNSYDDTGENWYILMNKVIPIIKKNAFFCVIPSSGISRLPWWYENHKPDWLMCWYKGSPGHRSPIGFNDWEAHIVYGKPKKQMHDFWQTKCGFEIKSHPCPKPVVYSEWIITRATKTKDIILDIFGGSGSTLIACEKTKRKCFMMEIDEHYCDVIRKRWAEYVHGQNCDWKTLTLPKK